MRYTEKRFSVAVGQINHRHPKAADLDSLFPKRSGYDPPAPLPDSEVHGGDGCVCHDSSEWTKCIRETGLIEHVCPHGVGHPDFRSIKEMEQRHPTGYWGVHGCDGCCRHESFPGRRID